MSQQFLDTLQSADWKANQQRVLQGISDLVGRHVNNRVNAHTSATAVALNGAPQSTGIGTTPATPSRFGEFLVHARVTFNLSAAGTLYVYVYRTTGAIPANGAMPNPGDEIVGGDAFAGPAGGAANVAGSLSFFDEGLSKTQAYRYYLVMNGTNGLQGNLVNSSQLVASEL